MSFNWHKPWSLDILKTLTRPSSEMRSIASTDPRGDGRDKSKDTVCIEVNGKNSYGAYNGFTWALIAMESKTVLLSSDPDAVANRFCSLAVPGPTVSQQAEQNR